MRADVLAALAQWRPNPVNSIQLSERALEMLDTLSGDEVPTSSA